MLEIENILIERRTITPEAAILLRERGLDKAREIGVSGFLMVFDAQGVQLTSQGVGEHTHLSVEIATAKAKTVLAMNRSTRVQRERMKSKSQNREDFGGQIGSLFGGGVAIFADEAKTGFVGAMAFSGGTEEQDEEICAIAITSLGLYTDLPPKATY